MTRCHRKILTYFIWFESISFTKTTEEYAELPFAFYRVFQYSFRYVKKKPTGRFPTIWVSIVSFSHHQVYLTLSLVYRNPKCGHFSFSVTLTSKTPGTIFMVILLSSKKQTLLNCLLTILSPHFCMQSICPFIPSCTSLDHSWEIISLIVLLPSSSYENCIRELSLWPSRLTQKLWDVSWPFLKFEINSCLDLNFEDPEIGSFHIRIKTCQNRLDWFGLATLAGRITVLDSSETCILSPENHLINVCWHIPMATEESVRINQCHPSSSLEKQIKACPSEYHFSFNSNVWET